MEDTGHYLIGVLLLGLASFFCFFGITVSSIFHDIEISQLNGTQLTVAMTMGGITDLVDSFVFFIIPSIITFLGSKMSIIIGGIVSLIVILKHVLNFSFKYHGLVFRIIDNLTLLLIWPAQGNYLVLYSSAKSVAGNAGIFWTFYATNILFSNMAVYFVTQGSSKIVGNLSSQEVLYWILFILTIIGIVVMIFLPKPITKRDITPVAPIVPSRFRKALQAFKDLIHILETPDMLVFGLCCFYVGMENVFCNWVYGVCLRNTYFLNKPENLPLLSGIFVGFGAILASLLIGMIRASVEIWGWNPIIVLGCFLHLVSFLFVLLNIPHSSTLGPTNERALMSSNVALALLCSILLGFGDACFNTQIISLLGEFYVKTSVSAFAVFKFFESIGMAVSLFYIFTFGIHTQIIILASFAISGTIAYVWVDSHLTREAEEQE